MNGANTDREQGIRSFVIRDLRVPRFHPEEPVLFLPEGREVINTFADLVTAGIDPPIPYVAPSKKGTYWYLGPVALLIAIGQSSRQLIANLLAADTSVTTMKVIAAKATLLRPIHWLAEARAWKILNQPDVRESATGFYCYASSKRRRVTELLRALQTIEVLNTSPPHLEHRAVSAVGPVVGSEGPAPCGWLGGSGSCALAVPAGSWAATIYRGGRGAPGGRGYRGARRAAWDELGQHAALPPRSPRFGSASGNGTIAGSRTSCLRSTFRRA